jgi:hypothetical protein
MKVKGSMFVEVLYGGPNVRLGTTHTPSVSIAIERADLGDAVQLLFESLTDDERHALAQTCCHGCGSLDTKCHCWDDL